MSVTFRDIAEACAVSPSTVSVALGGKPGVSEPIREKIVRKAEQLGYVPDPRLATLSERRWGNRGSVKAGERLAMVLTCADYNPELQKGFRDRARQLGYEVEVMGIRETGADADYPRILQARGIRGVLLMEGGPSAGSKRFTFGEAAVVAVGATAHNRHYHEITEDMPLAAFDLLQKLERTDYQRIAFATFAPRGTLKDMLRELTLTLLHTRLGDRCLAQPMHVQNSATDYGPFFQWVKDNRPDLLICVNVAFAWRLRKAGFNLPGDLNVLSLDIHRNDNQEWIAGYLTEMYQIGQRAADKLATSLARQEMGIPETQETILIASAWQAGRTLKRK